MRQNEKGGEQQANIYISEERQESQEVNGQELAAGDGGSDECNIVVGTFGWQEYTCSFGGCATLSFSALCNSKNIRTEVG